VGFPVFKLFSKDVIYDYPIRAGRQSADITAWLEKKMESPFVYLDTKEDFDAFTDKFRTVVGAFYHENSARYRSYEATAHTFKDELNMEFGLITNQGFAADVGMMDSEISVFRKDLDKVVYEGAPTFDDVSTFVLKNWVPDIFEYTNRDSEKIGLLQEKGVVKNLVMMFIDKDADYFDEKMKMYSEVRQEFASSDTLFAFEDCKRNGRNTFLQRHCNLVQTDCPAIRGIYIQDLDFPKVKPDPLTKANVRNLVNGLNTKTLEPYWRSANVPQKKDELDNGVRVLVSLNFDDVVGDQEKHVFVMFYTPWCAQCKKLMPDWEKLAEDYKDNEDIIIAKIDMIDNEVKEFATLYSWPVFKLFPKYKDTFVNFKENKTYEELKSFINIYALFDDTNEVLKRSLDEMNDEDRDITEKIILGMKVELPKEEVERFAPAEELGEGRPRQKVLTKEEWEEFDRLQDEVMEPHTHDDDEDPHEH
ncbi:unnamed protein product, partial [Owenia fusiformis]